MAATLQENEDAPASYPAAPSGLSTEAAALDAAFIRQRIEAYIAWRWTPRDVIWIVEGAGEWIPPLKPATVSTVEVWRNGAWEEVTLSASPLGGYCLDCGTYRVVGSVGSGDVPAVVNEAFRRIAEYQGAMSTHDSRVARSKVDGCSEVEFVQSPTLAARALINSGAADLLRPYRRAA